MDINQPKSRSFNMYLRYFQMGLQVLIATKLSQINSEQCQHSFQRIGQIVTITIIVLNLIAMVVTRCSHHFPRIFFFIIFVINIILAAIIIILSIIGMNEYNSCANNRILYRFAAVQGLIAVVLAFMIILLPFNWIQRYSNTPGNLVWVILFFGFAWSSSFKVSMFVEGSLFALISIFSLGINLIACKGITTSIKKIIVIEWIIGIILMVVGLVLALVVYLQANKQNLVFIDQLAIKLLITFFCVNILDLLFWIWGFLTLQYENGDKIRDQLMRDRNDSDISQNVEPYYVEDHNPNPAFGTIRR